MKRLSDKERTAIAIAVSGVMGVLLSYGIMAIRNSGDTNNEGIKPATQVEAVKYTETETVDVISMNVPAGDTSFKSYMDWQCITNTRSEQYKMQTTAYTDKNGLRRFKNGDYMVAMGSYYGEVGDRFRITFEHGGVVDCVMGDSKADIHTDTANQYTDMGDGMKNVVEFIVDTSELPDMARKMGDVSYADDKLWGDVKKVEKMK